jgi:hypothetical protein
LFRESQVWLALGYTSAVAFTNVKFNGPFNLCCYNGRFKHNDLEFQGAKYHLDQYLEEKGIYLPDFEHKYEIDQIYERCRYHGTEYSAHRPTSSTSQVGLVVTASTSPSPRNESSEGDNGITSLEADISPLSLGDQSTPWYSSPLILLMFSIDPLISLREI